MPHNLGEIPVMNENKFNPIQFYESYPSKVIARPGYPARAAFKSILMFGMYGERVLREIGAIATYADIGGCFGFGANAMAFHISKRQGTLPRTVVFEISSDFVRIGKVLFPHIEFVETEFGQWNSDVRCFDLISLFDVVEHVVDPESFLRQVSARSRYVLLKTPMETSGNLRGNKPPVNQGENHVDGHINFFTPGAYERLLNTSNFDIVESRLLPTIFPSGSQAILCPEQVIKPFGLLDTTRWPKKLLYKWPKRLLYEVLRGFPGVPWKLKRQILGGGEHICLCRSRSFDR